MTECDWLASDDPRPMLEFLRTRASERKLRPFADALAAAGFSDAEILGHCRSGGEHARGCWVLDAVLGRS